MKLKFIIIGTLIFLLGYLVWRMMKYENRFREERIIREYVEDETKPLVEKLTRLELRRIADVSDYYFRTDGDFFRHLTFKYQDSQLYWDTIFFKGVNLGVALPGKYPAEFSMTYDQYLDWLRMIGKMNANVVRLYTILPPEFYEAFAHYNLKHQNNPLYLIQGVWATVPDEDNYMDAMYTRSLKKEIIDVIDVLHGRAVLPEVRGKASGVYTTDVTGYVAAILFGREWEPTAVFTTNHENEADRYIGDFISVNQGSPMEVWLAEMIDFIVLYETQTYRMQRPVAFVNWLPLDPMYHNSEIIEDDHVREFDNDLESVDFNKFHSTELFRPGIFASYHVYPYYPDFIYNEEKYASNDNFKAYLLDLKRNHQGMPLLISEYGVPSSRGNSHSTPSGFDQGGHSEWEHAVKNVKLTKDIFSSGCAGAIYFEWADEWFKHNWLVMEFEQPFYDRKNWHNMENPEQNFGILALETRKKTIDGKLDDWDGLKNESDGVRFSFDADPTYFYLAFRFQDFDLEKNNFFAAFDVISKLKGDHKLPFSDQYFENGFEFLLEIDDKTRARILVDEPYSIYTDLSKNIRPTYASAKNENGKFIEQLLLSNRKRETLLGEELEQVNYNRSILKFGNTSDPKHSNSDWYFDQETGILEIRLTWHMLNASSPGLHAMLDNKEETPEIEYSIINSFNILAFITDENDKILRQIPERKPVKYIWEGWSTNPEYRSRLKPLYDSLQSLFRVMDYKDVEVPAGYKYIDRAVICPYYNDNKAALSLSFENSYLSHYSYALNVLDKYKVQASFGIVPQYIFSERNAYIHDEAGRQQRLSLKEIDSIRTKGHVIAYQEYRAENYPSGVGLEFQPELSRESLVYYGSPIRHSNASDHSRILYRDIAGETAISSSFNGVSFFQVPAYNFSQPELNQILDEQAGGWLIWSYKNICYNSAAEVKTGNNRNYTISFKNLDKQIRLGRNKNYWIAPEQEVFKYIREYIYSELSVNTHNDLIFLTIINDLNKDIFNHPLTVKYPCHAPYVEVNGSTHDGIYTNRNGYIQFHVVPGKEVILKMIW